MLINTNNIFKTAIGIYKFIFAASELYIQIWKHFFSYWFFFYSQNILCSLKEYICICSYIIRVLKWVPLIHYTVYLPIDSILPPKNKFVDSKIYIIKTIIQRLKGLFITCFLKFCIFIHDLSSYNELSDSL